MLSTGIGARVHSWHRTVLAMNAVRCFKICHGGRAPTFGFGDQQVNVFRHDYVSHHDEAITQANLFQYREETIPARGVEKNKRR